MNEYLTPKQATKILNTSHSSLRYWSNNGYIDVIKTPGNHRRYNVKKYLNNNKKINKLNICYVRVSTSNQKDDLNRQITYMQKLYPNYIIIKDIGSGINFNRKGLRLLIKYAISGLINNVAVAYKDRLTRFGFDLLESLIKDYSNGKIVVLNNKLNTDQESIIVEDVLQILNVYNAKINGMRKYKKKS